MNKGELTIQVIEVLGLNPTNFSRKLQNMDATRVGNMRGEEAGNVESSNMESFVS